jgi:alkylation response protein AidB-like acyl-CoA dehydrogenase
MSEHAPIIENPNNLSEEQAMILNMVKDIAKDVIEPRSSDIDTDAEYPMDIAKIYFENGIFGLPIPEEYDGSGASELTCCMVIEEVAKVCGNSAHCLADHWLGLETPLLGGTEELKQKYLPQWATSKIAAFALTEPEAGSDVGGMQTKAELKGDNWVLNGQKVFITNGGYADYLTVFARTGPGTKNINAYVVEKDFPGFKVGKREQQLGMRGTPAFEIVLEDCIVPKENLVGEEGSGFRTVMAGFDRSRPFDAVLAVGISDGAIQIAVDYAKERKQFGQTISQFQGLQWMLADMAIQNEAARQLVYKAACMVDMDHPEKSMYASMCNCFATDVGVKVTNDAMQVLGGYGYMKDYPLEQKMRDARLLQIVEGTNQVQRVIVSRALLTRIVT